jgi:Peptidase A4 family
LSPQTRNRAKGVACVLGSVLGVLVFLSSPPAFAGTPHDLSRNLSGSTVRQAAVEPCPAPTPATATCASPIVRVTRPAGLRYGAAATDAAASCVTALNWAGYDATGGGFSSVTATWVEPAVSPAGSTQTYASFWAGLDGDGSATAEQTGTAICSRNGIVTHYAWYEMYPAGEVRVPGFTVAAGDVVTATVRNDGRGSFTLSLVDQTSHASFSRTQPGPAGAAASAEIIAEAPTDSSLGRLIPLADFGAVDFSACAFNERPLDAGARNRIDMAAQGGAIVAATSGLSADGAGFSVNECAGDTAAPVTVAAGADDLWHNRPVAVAFAATDAGSAVAYTEYKLDQGAWTRASELIVAAPADHANDGRHTILYRSADGAGNLESARVCTVNIDTRAPRTVAARPVTTRHGGIARLAYAVDEAAGGAPTADVTITVRTAAGRLVKTIVARGVTLDTALVSRFACRLAAGRYRSSVAAVDGAGNVQSTMGTNTLTVS